MTAKDRADPARDFPPQEPYLKNQKRNRNREDAVTESFDPCCIHIDLVEREGSLAA
jgi:hypothetical protein